MSTPLRLSFAVTSLDGFVGASSAPRGWSTGPDPAGDDVVPRRPNAATANGGSPQPRRTVITDQRVVFAVATGGGIQGQDFRIDVDEKGKKKFGIVKNSLTLQQLVANLNTLGLGPRDLISILQAIKAAGAMQATLEVR